MTSKKIISFVILSNSGREVSKKEFYPWLYVHLNSFLMVAFPLNQIVRSLIGGGIRSSVGDIWPILPLQIGLDLGIAALISKMNVSSKILMNHHSTVLSQFEGVSIDPNNGDCFHESSIEPANVPDFHLAYLLYALGVMLPPVLWGIPKLITANVSQYDQLFPHRAFCVSDSICTTEEQENLICWWTQIATAMILMLWNRMSSHKINKIHNAVSTAQLPQGGGPIYYGDVIGGAVEQSINAIMSAGLIAFHFNGKVLDAHFARDSALNQTKWLFNDLGIIRIGCLIMYCVLSHRNWNYMMPKNSMVYAIHKVSTDENNNERYERFATFHHKGLAISGKTTVQLLAFTTVWVYATDRLLFTSYDNASTLVDMRYVNLVVFSMFLFQQLGFWTLTKKCNY